jgi:hypothetical protein
VAPRSEVPSSSRSVVAARLALLLLAAGAVAAAFAMAPARQRGAGGGGDGDSNGLRRGSAGYGCPMHPEVTGDRPDDDCPLCHMALEPLVAPEAARPVAAGGGQHAAPQVLMGAARRRRAAREVRAPAWREADGSVTTVLYRDELLGLEPGAPARFLTAAALGAAVEVRLAEAKAKSEADGKAGAAATATAGDGASATVRFHAVRDSTSADRPFVPGEVGWLELPARPREVIVVPVSALLYDPQGAYVLVPAVTTGDRSGGGGAAAAFTQRRVQIGSVVRGMAAVLSGLGDGEAVAVGSTFSLDAARRLESHRHQLAAVAR